jgi:hypothetical protein
MIDGTPPLLSSTLLYTSHDSALLLSGLEVLGTDVLPLFLDVSSCFKRL